MQQHDEAKHHLKDFVSPLFHALWELAFPPIPRPERHSRTGIKAVLWRRARRAMRYGRSSNSMTALSTACISLRDK
jgi:hypothetical protein